MTEHDDGEISRRDALARISGGLLAACILPHSIGAQTFDSNLPAVFATAGGERRIERIGLQLYTVRRAMNKNIEGTIAAIAAAGVHELEFAGYYNKSAKWWRDTLGRHGLTTPSTHIGIPAADSEWQAQFAFAKEMEHNWVIVPWIDAKTLKTADDWIRVAFRLNTAGRMAERAGLNFGYHNHDFEFASVGDTTGYELLMQHTEPDLVDFELDIYWAVKAGQNPVDMMAKWPGRYTCCHVKDAGPPPERAMLDVGAGTIDFADIIEKGRPQGLRHWFIEHDNPTDPIASVRASALAMMQI